WGHAEARKVAGDEVEQAGHGRGAGQSQDEDRREVVDGAEGPAQVAVSEEGEGASGRLAALAIVRGRDEQRGDEAREDQHHAHDSGRSAQELARVGDAATRWTVLARILPGVALTSVHERHDGDPGLEAAQAEREPWEDDERTRHHRREVALDRERPPPALEEGRVREHLPRGTGEDDEV